MDIEDKLLYAEDLIENQLYLTDEQQRKFRDMYNQVSSEQDLKYLMTKLSEHFVDKIDSGFNYNMTEIRRKIKRICK